MFFYENHQTIPFASRCRITASRYLDLICFRARNFFTRGKFQYYTEHAGKGPMAKEHLIIKYQILKFIPFNGHDNGLVQGVKGSYYPCFPGFQGYGFKWGRPGRINRIPSTGMC